MRNFLIGLLFFVMAAPVRAASDNKPVNWPEGGLPEPYATKSAVNPPRVIPKPADARLQLPEGFVIEEYLSGFVSPRFMLAGRNGEFLVSDTFAGLVYAIKDKRKKVLLRGLHNPYGLAFQQGWLYVAETMAVRRYKYNPETLMVSPEGETVVDLAKFNRGHITRTILFDRKGRKFYLSVGSESNVDAGEPPMRAAISRFNPDGSGFELFATGIRNGMGMRWYPGTDQLWVSSHERDALGDDLVPDYLTTVHKGDFLGWPYAYIGPHEDPRRVGEAPERVAKTRYPDVLLGSHVGAMDFIFYTGKQFPKKYQGGCFIAFHGSWNRSQRVGYRITFIPFKDGRPLSGPKDFITGWMLAPDSPDVWGRPVGLLQMEDGSLLISDDGGGKIWHVRYQK